MGKKKEVKVTEVILEDTAKTQVEAQQVNTDLKEVSNAPKEADTKVQADNKLESNKPSESKEAPNAAPNDMAAQMESYLRYIISRAVEDGIAPWVRDKTAEELKEDRAKKPFNPVTGISYSGANGLALESQGKETGAWLTKKQAESLGGEIEANQKGLKTFFVNKENEIRYAIVYNVSDVKNLDMAKLPCQKMISIDKKPSLDLKGINLYPQTKHQIAVYNKSISSGTDYKVPLLSAPKKQETQSQGLRA